MPTSALSSEQDLQRQLWRQQLRAGRRALTDEQQKQAAIGLAGHLPDHPWVQHASHVALYAAADGELDPQLLAEVLHTRGKTLVLPLLHPFVPQQLVFQRYLPHMALQPNRLGVLQPELAMNEIVPLFQIDVLLMPLVGFDATGTRLGMGGGFYDRTLATLAAAERPRLMGLAHAIQQVPSLPAATWDIPMQAIATANRVFMCDPNALSAP